MVFENSVPKANFGQNIRDSPNGSLTADSRSLQTATLNAVDMKTKSVISISQHHCLIFVWVWYHTIHTKPMVSFEKT